MVAVLLPRYACSVVCSWPGVCLNYTLSVESARKSSPCGMNWFGKREKVRPAREKWLEFGVFGRAGRIFSRFGQDRAAAGRTFSRGNGWGGRAGRIFSRFGQGEDVARRIFRALALSGHPPARRDGANHQQLADDGLLFGHADDAGALAQGQGRGHGHGPGAAREHEDNQHVFCAHGQDWGDAGG